jgi:hypothetical protein
MSASGRSCTRVRSEGRRARSTFPFGSILAWEERSRLRSSSLRRALRCPTFGSSREDGLIWVYGVGEDGVQAFTDFGIENLIEFVRFYKENPKLLTRGQRE